MSDNIPGYISRKIYTNLILRQFPDGGYQLDDNFCNLFNLSPAEFNRLAMEAPLTKRMVQMIKGAKETTSFCPFCGVVSSEECEPYCEYKRLLAEIAELEKAG